MTPPTICPPPGTSLPLRYLRGIDGDTQEFQIIGMAQRITIRHMGCHCPELYRGDEHSRRIARAAKQFAHERLAAAKEGEISAWIPFEPAMKGGVFDFTKLFHIGRALGYVYIGNQILGHMLVEAKLASSTEDGPLGE